MNQPTNAATTGISKYTDGRAVNLSFAAIIHSGQRKGVGFSCACVVEKCGLWLCYLVDCMMCK